ncbi:TIGR04283 family arsenosugar biosynthesis glycosyltransferase [Flavivirga spongiicola]|uniref:TIGR04283 family arsenosugar biosynthesis glycosyltransferase n=1 Tax=Flavivirga spongiicola TaxID=421621 RepID=A0ABU7XRQ9_9FLAO|nr:TIGR04283 family arsenosugar biosynthesis glycosyltransferase [Flavivirga sp. MEBiC05379]MDO5978148.1 TIGR04283 family arsenosugar biosynthesis glycosyltransferase [Flavivirga sp. MEBiC05379]
MNSISIIIPMLNEADHIGNLLTHLLDNSSKENISEIIIVDGGSTDGSLEIVSKYVLDRAQSRPNKDLSTEFIPSEAETIIKCISAPKGRAKQMNLGAKHATGNIFYFLHADSFPPKNFDALIINEVKKGHEAGCFRMKFNSNHLWLKLAGQLTRLPWKACRGGDQSQFITTVLFNDIGGFNEDFTIYEDNDLIAKLYDRKQFVVIQKWLTTSARCYCTNGVWRLQYYYWRIHLKKWMGADANELNRYYKKYVC